MPIDLKEWQELRIGKAITKGDIFKIFEDNKEKAYSVKELSEIFKVTSIGIYHHLYRLKQKGLIEARFKGWKAYYKYRELEK